MSKIKIFVFMIVLIVVAVLVPFFWLGRDGRIDYPEYLPEVEHYEPEVPDITEAEPEQTEPYYVYEPEEPYELDTEYADIDSPWHQAHFQNIREPHPLYEDTPHGYIAVRHIKHLNDNFYNRFPFSYQEKRAAAWIVQELLAIGYAWDDIRVQEFTLSAANRAAPSRFRAERDGHQPFASYDGFLVINDYNYLRNTYTSQNVILTVPGQSEQVIVIGAHYDTVLVPGASDNASGTALILENAQRMFNIDNYYTLVYVFFGAEEIGLLGAYYYVNSLTDVELDNILFMVNADVLFEGPHFVYAAGYQRANRTIGENNITRQWDEIALGLRAEGIYLHPSLRINLGSDHLAFMDAGITVMLMFGYYQVEDGGMHFRVWHSYRDCAHYIMNAWPYKIEDAMQTFSVFLEEILLAGY